MGCEPIAQQRDNAAAGHGVVSGGMGGGGGAEITVVFAVF